MCEPQENLDASVTNMHVMMHDSSGGCQGRPILCYGTQLQKFYNSYNDLLDSLTFNWECQPGAEFKSPYNAMRWYFALGMPSAVDCKYPIH